MGVGAGVNDFPLDTNAAYSVDSDRLGSFQGLGMDTVAGAGLNEDATSGGDAATTEVLVEI
jgi:hypothetical protein